MTKLHGTKILFVLGMFLFILNCSKESTKLYTQNKEDLNKLEEINQRLIQVKDSLDVLYIKSEKTPNDSVILKEIQILKNTEAKLTDEQKFLQKITTENSHRLYEERLLKDARNAEDEKYDRK